MISFIYFYNIYLYYEDKNYNVNKSVNKFIKKMIFYKYKSIFIKNISIK